MTCCGRLADKDLGYACEHCPDLTEGQRSQWRETHGFASARAQRELLDECDKLGGPGTVWPVTARESTRSLAQRFVEAWHHEQSERLDKQRDDLRRKLFEQFGIEVREDFDEAGRL